MNSIVSIWKHSAYGPVVLLLAAVIAFIGYLASGCDTPNGPFESPEHEHARNEKMKQDRWNGPCQDEATLVATTAGSPNGFTCWNKAHRMRVQVASAPSNEEFGAIVFCECERADGGL